MVSAPVVVGEAAVLQSCPPVDDFGPVQTVWAHPLDAVLRVLDPGTRMVAAALETEDKEAEGATVPSGVASLVGIESVVVSENPLNLGEESISKGRGQERLLWVVLSCWSIDSDLLSVLEVAIFGPVEWVVVVGRSWRPCRYSEVQT